VAGPAVAAVDFLAAADSPVAAAASAVVAPEGVGDMKEKAFLEQLQNDQIVAAIRAAEAKTSGEIRIFISRKETGDPLSAAAAEFTRMGMTQTAERNGVLIFVAPRSQKFALLGDQGIHERCGENFWREVAEQMTAHFQKSEFTAGIVSAIQKAGTLLAEHFPRRADDQNELPDAVERD
jgi:uncharacterized membrane protein